jgi:serine protease Do
VSTGIVSALHRDLKGPNEKVALGDLIQTDAAINPGNSGGPLLNAYGQVIGINTAIRGDAQNIGFSIPVNRLRDLIPELMNPAHARKLDVHVKLHEERSTTPPADVRSRVLLGDGKSARVVSSINGHAPRDIVDACAALLRLEAGQTCEICCDGSKDAVREKVTAVPLPDAIRQAKARLGLTIEPLTPLLAEQYGVQADDGLLVKGVARGSAAARAGIEPGDVIVQLGRYRVETLDDFAALLDRLPSSGRVRVGVVREGQLGVGVLDLGS